MADTKITDLASLTATSAQPDDVAAVVDVHDTSMFSSGTTKKITFTELGNAAGVSGRGILLGAGWALP